MGICIARCKLGAGSSEHLLIETVGILYTLLLLTAARTGKLDCQHFDEFPSIQALEHPAWAKAYLIWTVVANQFHLLWVNLISASRHKA